MRPTTQRIFYLQCGPGPAQQPMRSILTHWYLKVFETVPRSPATYLNTSVIDPVVRAVGAFFSQSTFMIFIALEGIVLRWTTDVHRRRTLASLVPMRLTLTRQLYEGANNHLLVAQDCFLTLGTHEPGCNTSGRLIVIDVFCKWSSWVSGGRE